MGKRKKHNGRQNIDRTLTSPAPLAGLVFCDNCHSVYSHHAIHIKLDNYAPKYALEGLKDIRTGQIQKASFENLLFGGGEGLYLPKSKFSLVLKDTHQLVLHRGYQIEDLLAENHIYI